MRWEKDDKFIEICSGLHYATAHNTVVSWVESNAFENGLPIEWRAQVPHSDTQPSELIAQVRAYAETHGFQAARPRGGN